MNTIIHDPNVCLVSLGELRHGDFFRWANISDESHDHVCIVLNYGGGIMHIKDLSDNKIYTRDPKGSENDACVHRLRVVTIEASL